MIKKLKHITQICRDLYEEKGASAVYAYMNDYMERSITGDCKYEYCSQCETSVPAWRSNCLLCGQQTVELSTNDSITYAYNKAGYEGDTVEECPNCETEVELKGEFGIQTCPECKKDIYPCSICRDLNISPMACGTCPLDAEKEAVVNAVIASMKKDFEDGDLTVIDELLNMLPIKNLINSLPEEQMNQFKNLER